MPETLKPCCEKARKKYVERVLLHVQSYPVIKAVPCPTCRQVIPIRIYAPPEKAGDATA